MYAHYNDYNWSVCKIKIKLDHFMELVKMSTPRRTTTNPGEQVLIGKHKNCFNKNILKGKKLYL